MGSLTLVAFLYGTVRDIQHHLRGVLARHVLSKSNHEEIVKHIHKVGCSVEQLAWPGLM